MPKARDCRLKLVFLNVATKRAQAAFANEPRCAPRPKPDKVGTSAHGLQAVVTDLQAKIAKVFGNCAQHRLAVRAALHDHDRVVHVPAVVLELERALTEVIQAVERDVRCNLREQISNRHALGLRALRKHHDQRDKASVLDPPRIARLQHRSVDSIEELAHINVQQPRVRRGPSHCILQPVGGLIGAAANPACKRGGDELALNDRRERGIGGMLNHKVAKRGRLDHARLGAVADHEALARRRTICTVLQRARQSGNVASEPASKGVKAVGVALFMLRYAPRSHECFWRADLRIEPARALHQ